MKKISILFLAPLLAFIGCDTQKPLDSQACAPVVCTEVFASVTVKIVDAQGVPLVLKNYSAVNMRTKDTLSAEASTDPAASEGYYLVANDSHKKSLSEKGDVIMVKGTHATLNKTIEGTFVIKGGRCACHIEKISGPEELKFN